MRNEPDFLVGLGLPSGSWRCRWHQASRTELEELCMTFDKGSVQGSGMDADGLFEYLGSAYADGSLSLTKTYHLHHIPVPASMSYIGKWDGRIASGQWIDNGYPPNNGAFQMWPGDGPEPALERERSKTPEISADSSRQEQVLVLSPRFAPDLDNHGH